MERKKKQHAFTAQKRVVITTNIQMQPIQEINLCGEFIISP